MCYGVVVQWKGPNNGVFIRIPTLINPLAFSMSPTSMSPLWGWGGLFVICQKINTKLKISEAHYSINQEWMNQRVLVAFSVVFTPLVVFPC